MANSEYKKDCEDDHSLNETCGDCKSGASVVTQLLSSSETIFYWAFCAYMPIRLFLLLCSIYQWTFRWPFLGAVSFLLSISLPLFLFMGGIVYASGKRSKLFLNCLVAGLVLHFGIVFFDFSRWVLLPYIK